MTQSRYVHSIALNEQEENDLITCQSQFSIMAIFRLGLKECLKQLPKPPKEAIKRAKEMV